MVVSPAVDAELTGSEPDRPQPDQAEPDQAETDRSDEGARVSASRRFRVVVLGVLVLALLASAGILVWLLADRRGAAEEQQAEREAVMSQTDQFVLRLNTYGPDLLDDQQAMPEYSERVSAVITPKFAADFTESGLPIAEQTVAQAGYGRTATILGTGVESLETDSATALVAATLTSSYPDPDHPEDQAQRIDTDTDVLRWVVDLVKVDGTWLVDGYTPVTGSDAGAGEGQQ